MSDITKMNPDSELYLPILMGGYVIIVQVFLIFVAQFVASSALSNSTRKESPIVLISFPLCLEKNGLNDRLCLSRT